MERFHRTLKADTATPPQQNRREQQAAFDRFRAKYNEERPHEALGQAPPARHYQPSNHCYPSRLSSPEYGDEAVVRPVRSNGEIKWQSSTLYLSEALIGEPVGLIPRDGRYLCICFGSLRIGDLDTYTKRVLRTPIQVLPMSLV